MIILGAINPTLRDVFLEYSTDLRILALNSNFCNIINIDRIESVAYPCIISIPIFLLTFPFTIAHYMFKLARYAFKLNRYCLAICLKSIVMFELASINLSLSLCNNLLK